jgi:long-chain-fatty-acid--CoA ligase ACSBG
MEVFKLACKNFPNKVALRVERPTPRVAGKVIPPTLPREEWTTWSYQQYYDDVWNVAKGFMALGVEQHDAVNIFGFNAPEWHISQLAAGFAGGKAAGIYPSDTPEQVRFKAVHSGAAVMVIEDESKVRTLLAALSLLSVCCSSASARCISSLLSFCSLLLCPLPLLLTSFLPSRYF